MAAPVQKPMKRSAGILLYKLVDGEPRVLLVHPGGPYWARRDSGRMDHSEGRVREPEEPLAAAIREFGEETGMQPRGNSGPWGNRPEEREDRHRLGLRGRFRSAGLVSNLCEVEWPGTAASDSIPEVDRAAWFTLDEARAKMNPAQTPFLSRLAAILARVTGP